MIEFKNMYKNFGSYTVLEDINFTLEEGKIYGIVGINGAGKSTLIRHIAGVYKCDSGEVLYNGKPIYDNVEAKREIIFLSDSPYFFHNSNINSMKKYLSTYYDFDNELFERLHKVFNLDLNTSINKFSKGMKKQSELLLGLCCKPKVILLDETFDGLDPLITAKTKALLIDIVDEIGVTILISSHNLIGLDSLCDSIFLLDKNSLRLQKDEHDIKSLFKIQLYFKDCAHSDIIENLKANLDVLDVKEIGSILNVIIRGVSEEINTTINSLHPTIFDILEFTFEERFIYELGGTTDEQDI